MTLVAIACLVLLRLSPAGIAQPAPSTRPNAANASGAWPGWSDAKDHAWRRERQYGVRVAESRRDGDTALDRTRPGQAGATNCNPTCLPQAGPKRCLRQRTDTVSVLSTLGDPAHRKAGGSQGWVTRRTRRIVPTILTSPSGKKDRCGHGHSALAAGRLFGDYRPAPVAYRRL